VESNSITSALDFEKTDRFAVKVQDTSVIDTAFSSDLRERATELLIDDLEGQGFDYVGERNPELRVAFSTYVTTEDGYVNTSLPVERRIVSDREIGGAAPLRGRAVTTSTTADPIYVPGSSRLFILDVRDSETEVLLWRAYTIADSTGLDKESLSVAIEQLVNRLDEET